MLNGRSRRIHIAVGRGTFGENTFHFFLDVWYAARNIVRGAIVRHHRHLRSNVKLRKIVSARRTKRKMKKNLRVVTFREVRLLSKNKIVRHKNRAAGVAKVDYFIWVISENRIRVGAIVARRDRAS